ncbi:MAG: energy-coupling factor transporter transmembrane protein EcfT [Clostridia bacterium]|nr:energy-coupling factor transporter transmembrane protein EcfT [Clostridia bacterium]
MNGYPYPFNFNKGNSFFRSLHTGAAALYLFSMLVMALIFTHPLYLLGLSLAIVLAAALAGGLKDLESFMKPGIVMVLLIMGINLLGAGSGETVLWRSPLLPFFGRAVFTLEALCFGAAMGIRLLAVLGIFFLLNVMVHPDRLLRAMSLSASKSALVVSLALRLLPGTARRLDGIREALIIRGVVVGEGRFKERAQKYMLMLGNLLAFSLEDSFTLAEAMEARGYGGYGKKGRSLYRRERIRPRDVLIGGCAVLALLLSALAVNTGAGSFSYYPRLAELVSSPETLYFFSGIMFFLLVPLFVGWGWDRWHYLKSKI